MSIAIAVCLLGLGASATVLTLFPRLREEERARSVAAAYAVAGGLAVPLAHAVFARVSPTMFDAAWRTVATLIVLTIPYFVSEWRSRWCWSRAPRRLVVRTRSTSPGPDSDVCWFFRFSIDWAPSARSWPSPRWHSSPP